MPGGHEALRAFHGTCSAKADRARVRRGPSPRVGPPATWQVRGLEPGLPLTACVSPLETTLQPPQSHFPPQLENQACCSLPRTGPPNTPRRERHEFNVPTGILCVRPSSVLLPTLFCGQRWEGRGGRGVRRWSQGAPGCGHTLDTGFGCSGLGMGGLRASGEVGPGASARPSTSPELEKGLAQSHASPRPAVPATPHALV